MKLEINGIHLNVEVSNESSPKAFIWAHGLLGNIESEYETEVLPFDKLSEVCKLIRFDARGHGNSEDEVSRENHRWDKLADDLLAIADKLELEKFYLGGTSKGAGTALWAACKAPERVEGLVLKLLPDAWYLRQSAKLPLERISHTLRELGMREFCKLVQSVPVPKIMQGLKNQKAIDVEKLQERSVEVVDAIIKGTIESDLPPMANVAKLKIPSLILAWADMPGHPLEISEEVHQLIEHSTLLTAENPKDVLLQGEAVVEFLR